MPKILTDREIGEIFKKVTTEDFWIDDSNQYQKFLEATAEVCADHFGGEVASVSYRGDDELGWAIIFTGDENVPEGGGIYAKYDTDAVWDGEPDDFEDDKVLTDAEMGDLIYGVLTTPGVIDDSDQYLKLLNDLGDILSDHFGGEMRGVSYDEGDGLGYTLSFYANDSLPPDGGIYKGYDTDVVWKDGAEDEFQFPVGECSDGEESAAHPKP